MKKILYVDVPFATIPGGDTNRSSFIWSALSSEFETDLLLIKTAQYKTKLIPPHSGYGKIFSIAASDAPLHASKAIHHFHSQQLQKYRDILASHHYDIIVFRFLSTFKLAEIAEKYAQKSRIFIDVDMLFSRISELSWEKKKSLRNRYHFLELNKLRPYEDKAFKHDFNFLFTNPVEREYALSQYKLKPHNAHVFPNMMPVVDRYPVIDQGKDPYILFFGTLNSMANIDAMDYLVQDIYPALKSTLQKSRIKIRVVGKNPLPRIEAYNDANIQIVGPVDDIYQEIASAMFVILPIRVASGTRTRILEAASQAKAVITTPIGAEGFDFTSREITIAENASSFLKAVQNLLSDTKLRDELGENLFRASVSRYAQGVVVKGFIDLLNGKVQNHKPQAKALKLAIITNRFYPEVGGAETNIYFQAKLLAKHHQVTVLCPKRSTSPTVQNLEGFRIIRYNDLLNRENRFPNLKSKTLCPGMILHLALSRYDIIQCYPALNYNNMLAYLIARIKGMKYILCFFDFMDYAAHICKHKKIEPEILKNIKPRFYQLPILRGMDYAFAIAEREIKFLKQYNPNVEYSPVPVLLQEYETSPQPPSLFGKFPDNSFVFLCLGRVSYIKGQDIALRAFRKAHELMPDAKLIFVGRTDYEPEYFKELEALSSDPLLVEKVFFTGQLSRQEVLSFLHYSDIHIIPVRFMNSGAVVVESWFSNTPVLQSNVVDPNLVIEDINGYLFDSESIDSCTQKMIKAYTNREVLPDLAQKGKELVREKYTYEYLISLYNKTYSKLLD